MIALLMTALALLPQDARQEAFAAKVFGVVENPAALREVVVPEPWRAERLVRELVRQSVIDLDNAAWPLEMAGAIAEAVERETGRATVRGEVEQRRGMDEGDLTRYRNQEELWVQGLEAAQLRSWDHARTRCREALVLAEELNLPQLIARTERTLGRIAVDERSFEDGVGHLERALDLLPDDPLENAVDLAELTRALRELGRLEEAVTSLARVDQVRARAGIPHPIPYAERAELLARSGDTQRAREVFAHEVEGLQGPSRADLLLLWSAFEGSTGRYAGALRLMHDAEAQLSAEAHPERWLRLLVQRAAVLSEVGRSEQAHREITRAEQHWNQLDEPVGGRTFLMQTAGLIELDLGQLESATRRLAEVIGSLEVGPRAAEPMRQLARVHVARGELTQALTQLRAVTTFGPRYQAAMAHIQIGHIELELGHPTEALDAFRSAQELQKELPASPEVLWRILDGVARVAIAEGDPSRAYGDTLMAIADIERIAEALDAPALRLMHLDEELDVYRRGAWLSGEQGFEVSGRMKSHALQVASPPGDPALSAALEALSVLELERSRCLRTGARFSLVEQLEQARARVVHARFAIELNRSISKASLPTVEELVGLLGARRALVDYVLAEEGCFAFVVDRSGLRRVDLAIGREDLRALVRELDAPRRAMQAGRADLSNLRFPVAAAARAYEVLVDPLQLQDTTHVILLPDDVLWHVPWPCLVRARVRRPVDPAVLYDQYARHRYWLEDVAISVVPSPQWISSQPGPGGAGRVRISAPAPLPNDAPPVGRVRATALDGVTALQGDAASEPMVLAALANSRHIHIAAHAELDTRWPAGSRLALGATDEDDGWLHAFELTGLQIPGAHVVLSACESSGPLGGLAGVRGLPRAFFGAGARSVVASRWSVDDEATTLLFAHYDAALERGVPPVEALREAQIACKNAGRAGLSYAHPWFWAGFTHYGAN